MEKRGLEILIIIICVIVFLSIVISFSWQLFLREKYHEMVLRREENRKMKLRKMTNFSEDEHTKKCQVDLSELEQNVPEVPQILIKKGRA